jgi:hypothetical protein
MTRPDRRQESRAAGRRREPSAPAGSYRMATGQSHPAGCHPAQGGEIRRYRSPRFAFSRDERACPASSGEIGHPPFGRLPARQAGSPGRLA